MTWTTAGEVVTATKMNEVFPAGDDAYQAWTPTLTNLTQGNGTIVARYHQVGKSVHAYFIWTFGSTSSVDASSNAISLPVTASSNATNLTPIGIARFRDTGTASYEGVTELQTGLTTISPRVSKTDGTYATAAAITSVVPFTWTTGDIMFWDAKYEAA